MDNCGHKKERNEHLYQLLTRRKTTVEQVCSEYYAQLQHRQQAATRLLPKAPDRVLDAPSLQDDFYLNTLDWGVRGELAVALSNTVYLWTEDPDGAGTVRELCALPAPATVTSLGFIHDGTSLALGLSTGHLQIWDLPTQTRLRTMAPGDSRLSSLSWNKHLISCGSKTGALTTLDVRAAPAKAVLWREDVAAELCGLKWSWDGEQLAAGANDNQVRIYDAAHRLQHSWSHRAAVKALAWSPWSASVLASGGGSACRTAQIHCCKSGQLLSTIDTGSQISGITWSKLARGELATVHGFPDNSIKLWKNMAAPSLLASIDMAHDQRILHSSLSPCGRMLCTAGADECIKFWRVFQSPADDEGESKRAALIVPKLLPTFAKNKQHSKSSLGFELKKKK